MKVKIGAGAIIVIVLAVTGFLIYRGDLPNPLGGGLTDGPPTQTVEVGTSRHPTLTTFIYDAILGTNVGDDTNDHAYIIELKDAYKSASYSEIKAAYMANPEQVCEARGGWDDTTPPAAGVASADTYDVGQQVLIYVDAQTEYDAVFLYTVKEPDYQATTTQVRLPVFTPNAAWAETYQTEISTIIAEGTNYDLSDEGGDTEDTISYEIRGTTADSVLGWFLKDPVKDGTQYRNNIPYFYISSNLSTCMVTDAEDAWDDGSTFTYFFSLDSQKVAPEDWGCPSDLKVISGEPIGINVDADANDGFIKGQMTWSVIAATATMTCGLEASDWDQEFGLGTPTGDVTEAITVQA